VLTKLKVFFSVNWIKTIYFNFHYLPFEQAKRFPIWIYKAKLLKCKGQVIIQCDDICSGMIRLGQYAVSLYPDLGIVWENHGGTVIFNGNCSIHNSSAISIGSKGKVFFGKEFVASCLKLTSYYSVYFSDFTRIGWSVIIMDTNFHRLKNLAGKKIGTAYGEIFFGKNNWIASKCIVLESTRTSDYSIFSAGSILHGDYSDFPSHSIIAGNPLEVKATGVWRDIGDDSIDYDN
jgi:acetyltransferase-like isoleucine patch superfamily enzyme